MITRRLLLTVPPGVLFLSSNTASAQSEHVEAPTPEEVADILRSAQRYRNMLIATEALRLVLMVVLSELNKGPSTLPPQDFDRWIRLLEPFQEEPFREEVIVKVESKDGSTIIIDAAANVTPTASRIQNALAEGGVDGQVGRDMIRSFYIFVQLRAVVEQRAAPATDSWYCSIYPFSYFCHQT